MFRVMAQRSSKGQPFRNAVLQLVTFRLEVITARGQIHAAISEKKS